MRVIVQKYGGSSLATADHVRAVAQNVVRTKEEGLAVVVVVSAMGDTTDHLLEMGRRIGTNLSPRELDMLLSTGETASAALLAMAIQNLRQEAISLSAKQCGIITNDVHTNARILEIRPQRIKQELARGAIVVAPGFQGRTREDDITTLGRGGSDTTAVALAAALNAEKCVIYTDVEGVFTADPRIVPTAIKRAELGARETQELAWHGAKVLKAEAVEFASTNEVPLVVRSTFSDDPGTVVLPACKEGDAFTPREPAIAGVSGREDLVRIILKEWSPRHGGRDGVYGAISDYDMVFESIGPPGEASDLFISNQEMPDEDAFARQLQREFEGEVRIDAGLGAVSLVGFGLGSRPAALLSALKVLEDGGATLIKSFSARDSFTFIIPRAEVSNSLRLLHRTFVESTSEAVRPAQMAAS